MPDVRATSCNPGCGHRTVVVTVPGAGGWSHTTYGPSREQIAKWRAAEAFALPGQPLDGGLAFPPEPNYCVEMRATDV